MEIGDKARPLVRLRSGELSHIFAGETSCPDQRQVTTGTAAIRCREMGSLNPVTVEAAAHHRESNSHPIPRQGMAGLASHCRIAIRAAHRLGVVTVGEAEIGARQGRRLPPRGR